MGVNVFSLWVVLIVPVFLTNPQAAVITTVAGNGDAGFEGDDGPAILASLNRPAAVFVDEAGTLYIADTSNHRIRAVDGSGTITTVAGNGTAGFGGDGGPATEASLNTPHGIFVTASGEILFCDTQNHRLRRISPDGTIATVAGTGAPGFSGDTGAPGFSGDTGPATEADLNRPHDVTVDQQGNIYIADTNNHRVRRVAVDGGIATVVGTGEASFSGDGGEATDAALAGPVGVGFDSTGVLYVSDRQNLRIRAVGQDAVISTVAGNGTTGFSGDGGPAVEASTTRPRGLSVQADGTIYFTDRENNRIRTVSPDGTITTVVGNGERAFTGDDVSPTETALNFPRSVFAHSSGLYIADRENHRIRFVDWLRDPDEASSPSPTADFNADGSVDFVDFLAFASHFGSTSGSDAFDPAFDLNADSAISFPDFLIFAAAFGQNDG